MSCHNHGVAGPSNLVVDEAEVLGSRGDLDERVGLSQPKEKGMAHMLKWGFIKSGKLALFRLDSRGRMYLLMG